MKKKFLQGKQYKNTDMVYADSPVAAQRNSSFIANKKSIFNSSGIDPHPFDKPFGFVVGSNR
ncbi:MAG: hypothetical protein LBS55_10140 [Prevotellaceae bacterium]|jgi:hypothetical protein|nr:hypothetical protein [Prevotellaceae bacterium]